MTFSAGAEHAARAERVSRLAFEYLSELLADWRGGPESEVEVGRLVVEASLDESGDESGDESAARAAAAEIYRALTGALH